MTTRFERSIRPDETEYTLQGLRDPYTVIVFFLTHPDEISTLHQASSTRPLAKENIL